MENINPSQEQWHITMQLPMRIKFNKEYIDNALALMSALEAVLFNYESLLKSGRRPYGWGASVPDSYKPIKSSVNSVSADEDENWIYSIADDENGCTLVKRLFSDNSILVSGKKVIVPFYIEIDHGWAEYSTVDIKKYLEDKN